MEKIYLMTHKLRWSQHLSPVSLPRENKITSLFSYLEPHPYQNLVFKNSGMTKWNDQEYVIWSVVEWGWHCRTSKGKFFKSRIRGHAIWQITDWKKKEEWITHRGFSVHCPTVKISGFTPSRLWSCNAYATCFQPGTQSWILSESLWSTAIISVQKILDKKESTLWKSSMIAKVNDSDRNLKLGGVCVFIYMFACFLTERASISEHLGRRGNRMTCLRFSWVVQPPSIAQ